MSDIKIAAGIALDGEAEFRKAVAGINSELKVLSSEMKLNSAAFEDNADSVDALTSKSDILNRQLQEQKEKVNTLRAALEKSKVEHGENTTQTNKWQIALNNAEREVLQTEKAVRKNNDALKDAKQKTDQSTRSFDTNKTAADGLNDVVKKLAGRFGIDLPDGMMKSTSGAGALSAGMAGMIGVAAGLAAAIFKVVEALAGLTIKQAAAADEILTDSTKYGLSTDTIQEINYAAELMDTSSETIFSGLKKITRAMDDAQAGNAALADRFKQLGVSVVNADGSLRDAEDVFWDSIDALGEISNEAERDAIAMDLMGKSAMDLNPLIAIGSAGFKELADQAHASGYVLNEEMLKTLGDVDDAVQIFKNDLTTLKNKIALEFAPATQEMIETGGELLKTFGEFMTDSGFIDFLSSVVHLLSELSPILEPVIRLLGGSIDKVFKPLARVLELVADAIGAVVDAWQDLRDSVFDGIFGGDKRGGFFGGSGDPILHWGSNAGGTDYWRGGMTWVGEDGPELVNLPTGAAIYNNPRSMAMTGGDIYNITIDASNVREFNDIIRIAQGRRVTQRMGYAGAN